MPVVFISAHAEFFVTVDLEPTPVIITLAPELVIEGECARLCKRDYKRQGRGGIAFSGVSGLGVNPVAFGDDLPRVGFVIFKAQACTNRFVGNGKFRIFLALVLFQIVGDDFDRSLRDVEFIHAVLMPFQRNERGIGADVLRIKDLFTALVECECGKGQTVLLGPLSGADVGFGVLAVVHFVYCFGVQCQRAVGTAGDRAGRGMHVGIFVVSQSPVVHVFPLRVEGHVAHDFEYIPRLVSVAGAVLLGVPAVKDEIRFTDPVVTRDLDFALDVVSTAAGDVAVSAVDIIVYGVAQIGIEHTRVVGNRNVNRQFFPLTEIENIIQVAVPYHSGTGHEIQETTFVIISYRQYDDAHRMLLAVCEDPQQRVKRGRAVEAVQFFARVDSIEFRLRRHLSTAVTRNVNLGVVCNKVDYISDGEDLLFKVISGNDKAESVFHIILILPVFLGNIFRTNQISLAINDIFRVVRRDHQIHVGVDPGKRRSAVARSYVGLHHEGIGGKDIVGNGHFGGRQSFDHGDLIRHVGCNAIVPVYDGKLRPVLARVKGCFGKRLACLGGAGFVCRIVVNLRRTKHFFRAGDRRFGHAVTGCSSFRNVDSQRCRTVLIFQRTVIIYGAHARRSDGIAAIRDGIFEYVHMRRVMRINGGFTPEEGLLRNKFSARPSSIPTSEEHGRIANGSSGRAIGDRNMTVEVGSHISDISGSAVYVKGYSDNAANVCLHRGSFNLVCCEGNGQIIIP